MPVVASTFAEIIEQARLAARSFVDFGEGLFNPTLRLGITGLSRAGKTVFITALVHGLIRGGRFPVFEALANGRIAGARLAPQPDDAVPRFDYEGHVRALVQERRWPESTRRISELRVVINYQSRRGTMRTLTLDIVDYPGEWLLDLSLLEKSYEQWSAESVALSCEGTRAALAKDWHAHLDRTDANSPADENVAIEAAHRFTTYLRACRDDRYAMSLLPPGRFLMPGDLDGSPALTFAPLVVPADAEPAAGSLWAMMRRRYDAYREVVVRPFFREHFALLDRQIVLVDALAAFNAGPQAVRDLQGALTQVLDCFRVGAGGVFSAMFRPRADKLLFAATKADHLHGAGHDRLEAILERMTARAVERASFAGAEVDVIALAAVRATREAMIKVDGEMLPAIVGMLADGGADAGEVAVFPGDLPADAGSVFAAEGKGVRGTAGRSPPGPDYRFVRFRPPGLVTEGDGPPALPHIRLDRALQFLLGDRLP